MERKIKSVEKGWGEGSTFFTTYEKAKSFPTYVDEIKEESKQVSPNDIFNVYRGYIDGKLVFEMGATSDITVIFS